MSHARILATSVLIVAASAVRAATVVEAAGATFPYPIYAKWFEAFHRHFPDFEIRYRAVGSEGGVQQLIQRKVDFAASDIPISALEARGAAYMQFPAVLGAVVPIYNVRSVSGALQFTPEALAGIYLGKIKKSFIAPMAAAPVTSGRSIFRRRCLLGNRRWAPGLCRRGRLVAAPMAMTASPSW